MPHSLVGVKMIQLQSLKHKHWEGHISHLLNLLKQSWAGHSGRSWDLKLDLPAGRPAQLQVLGECPVWQAEQSSWRRWQCRRVDSAARKLSSGGKHETVEVHSVWSHSLVPRNPEGKSAPTVRQAAWEPNMRQRRLSQPMEQGLDPGGWERGGMAGVRLSLMCAQRTWAQLANS